MTILLADDDQSIRDLFTTVLTKAGYDVITAASGKETLQKIRESHIDIILLDQIFPDMNGNQILQTLKADSATSNIPVAVVSNYSQDKIMEEAMRMGASDYILKYQIEPQDLLKKIEELISEYHPAEITSQTTPTTNNQTAQSA